MQRLRQIVPRPPILGEQAPSKRIELGQGGLL
jgi:hypothetical protein